MQGGKIKHRKYTKRRRLLSRSRFRKSIVTRRRHYTKRRRMRGG